MMYPTPIMQPFRFINACDFDGVNDFLSINSSASLSFGTGDFSISFWMNADALGVGSLLICNINSSDAFAWGIYLSHSGGLLRVELRKAGLINRIFSTAAMSTGVWQHWVFAKTTNNASNWRIYRNGVVGQTVNSNAMNGIPGADDMTNGYIWTMGALNNTAQPYNGRLDEVTIYDSLLSSSDAAYLYNGGRGNPPSNTMTPNLSARYPLDSWSGTLPNPVFPDVSGNTNTATGQNMATDPLVPHT